MIAFWYIATTYIIHQLFVKPRNPCRDKILNNISEYFAYSRLMFEMMHVLISIIIVNSVHILQCLKKHERHCSNSICT